MKKRILSIVLAVMMLISAMPVVVSAAEAPSKTTINGATYYQLDSADDLVWFAQLVNGNLIDGTERNGAANAILTADIDLTDVAWTPIGMNTGAAYAGIFDGAGYTISGLLVETDTEYASLFGYVKEGGIKNLTVGGSVKGPQKVGMIAAYMFDSALYNCKAVGDATYNGGGSLQGYIGGLAGIANHCVIINCASEVDVTVDVETFSFIAAGGLFGVANASNNVPQCILNSYSTGDITVSGNTRMPGAENTSRYYVGGIAGYLSDDAVNNYYYGEITDKDEDSGKYVGYAFGHVEPEFRQAGDYNGIGKIIVKNNYYPEGKTAIASVAVGYSTDGYATGISEANASSSAAGSLVETLKANKTAVEEIIVAHRDILSDSQWSGLVERIDGAKFTVADWKLGEDGMPTLIFEVDGGDDGNDCNHLCHKQGWLNKNIFWPIVRTFWKLFKINPVCDCGAAHY